MMSGDEPLLPARPVGVTADSWAQLRTFTTARIALGRADVSLPTRQWLAFQADHARARDAVHAAFDAARFARALERRGFVALAVRSRADSRETFIRRPDLGRQLDAHSAAQLDSWAGQGTAAPEAAFVVADGLSAAAVRRHAASLLEHLHSVLLPPEWQFGPVVVVEQGRVAIADEIGERLGVQLVVILLGERPGLSAADSLGAYLTFAPRVGRTDAERNCVSNIRSGGLSYPEAAHRIAYLMREARRRSDSGVMLKDESDRVGVPSQADESGGNFLVE